MMRRFVAIFGFNLMLSDAARITQDANLDVDWGVPRGMPSIPHVPAGGGGGGTLPGPLKAVPIGKITEASGLAQEAVEKAKRLQELAKKLLSLKEACLQAQVASKEGERAVGILGTNTKDIHQNITTRELTPLFDGQWKKDDMVVLKQKDIYLGIVNTILASTGHLTGVTDALNSIIKVLTSVVDLLKSVEELTPAIGDSNIEVLNGLSTRATTVGTQCDAEATKISAAETKLRPVLTKYEDAKTPPQKGVVVGQNFNTFKTGFNDVGNAWMSVKAFYNDKVKPLMDRILAEVNKLKGNVQRYQLPSR
jgi:hypothetical protein